MQIELELVEKVNINGKTFKAIYALVDGHKLFVALADKYNYAFVRKLSAEKVDK